MPTHEKLQVQHGQKKRSCFILEGFEFKIGNMGLAKARTLNNVRWSSGFMGFIESSHCEDFQNSLLSINARIALFERYFYKRGRGHYL